MANYLDIEPLNCLKFIGVNPTQSAAWHTKHFDDYLFYDQIGEWEEHVRYCNKWEKTDVITLQFKSTLAPAVVDIMNEYGVSVQQTTATGITTGLIGQDYEVYEANVPLNIAEGCYQLRITCGDPLNNPQQAISEPICLKTTQDNTVLIAYSNSINKDGIVFEEGLELNYRVDARITSMTPGSRDTLYEDQILREVMIKSYPYRVFRFVISYAAGVPDYVIDKLNRILGCDYVTIDGKQFVKNEGAKWERQGSDHYPMAGWAIELREGGNNGGTKRITGGTNPDEAFAVVYNIETDAFGPISFNTTGTLVTITKVQ